MMKEGLRASYCWAMSTIHAARQETQVLGQSVAGWEQQPTNQDPAIHGLSQERQSRGIKEALDHQFTLASHLLGGWGVGLL